MVGTCHKPGKNLIPSYLNTYAHCTFGTLFFKFLTPVIVELDSENLDPMVISHIIDCTSLAVYCCGLVLRVIVILRVD